LKRKNHAFEGSYLTEEKTKKENNEFVYFEKGNFWIFSRKGNGKTK
jgi:hypothetical protein